VPKDSLAYAKAYQKLLIQLNAHGKTPEDAVKHYLAHLGSEIIRQAKPFIDDSDSGEISPKTP